MYVNRGTKTMKLILDLDTGVDDAIALAYVANLKEHELIGVTTVFGNVHASMSARNSRSLLNKFKREDVPVYLGVDNPLEGEYVRTDRIKVVHGEDGIGNTGEDWKVKDNTGIYEDAVDFIVESARKYKDELIIIATSPLTNIALALQKDKQAMLGINSIISMAGAIVYAGNRNKLTEANVGSDPEAAKIVFESGIKLTMIGLDVTHKVPMIRKYMDDWRINEIGNILADAVDYYYTYELKTVSAGKEMNIKEKGGCMIHDATAAIYLIHPEYFKTIDLPLTVLTDFGRGRTVGDLLRIDEENVVTSVAIDVDGMAVLDHLQESLLDLLKKCN